MNRIAFAIVATVAVFSMARTASAQTPDPRGIKVFADQKCSLCHSIAGKGNAKGALDGVGTKLKPEDIRKWIATPAEMAAAAKATRKPAMKAYPNLPKADLDALVGYLASLKAK
jgi:mono/diheme cytochrome c family protein